MAGDPLHSLAHFIGVPVVANAVMLLLFSTMVDARISAFEAAINRRFDDMRELWRTELCRVEEVLDARLKHIEEEHERP